MDDRDRSIHHLFGLYALGHSRVVAERNKAFVDSGEETYFEQRREWEHYGAPATTVPAVRRAAWFGTLLGAAGILFCIISYCLE